MYEVNRESVATPSDRIRVVGLGKAGTGVVDWIIQRWPATPAAASVNTDANVLAASLASARLQIGKDVTRGMGAGGNPQAGKQAAEADTEMLEGLFRETDLVFLVVGLGGGTGTGAAPIVVKAAHAAGALTLCFVTLPFQFEGRETMERAEAGLEELLKSTDMAVVVPNEKLYEACGGKMGLAEAFQKVRETVGMGIYAVWKLVSSRGCITLDFADLCNLAKSSGGVCAIGYGYGTGADKVGTAVTAALNCPVLGEAKLGMAEAVLVSIIGSSDLALAEISRITTEVSSAARKGARIFMGAAIDSALADGLLVTIVASERWKPRRDSAAEEQTGGEKQGRRKKAKVTQTDFDLLTEGRGWFKGVAPTMLDGADMDVPTFRRRGVFIEK